MGLGKERELIDGIDRKLISLLEERLEVAEAIGRYKLEHGMKILDPQRERRSWPRMWPGWPIRSTRTMWRISSRN